MTNTTAAQDPNGLLDMLIEAHALKSDAALARMMQVAPPCLSKMRAYKMPVGDSFVLRCMEMAGLTLAEVRAFVPSPYVGAA